MEERGRVEEETRQDTTSTGDSVVQSRMGQHRRRE
jgi:hypothetical protein